MRNYYSVCKSSATVAGQDPDDATVRPEDVAKEIVCGPDAQKHLQAIDKFVKAGFDHVYVHQVGHDQDGFFRFYEREVLPNLDAIAA